MGVWKAWAGAWAVAGFAASPGLSAAESADNAGYLFGGVQYVQPDSGRGADYGTGVFAGYGAPLGSRFDWELRLGGNVLETGMPGLTDFYQAGIGLDLLLPLGDRDGAHFFALAGAAGVFNDVTPDSEDAASAVINAGMGWRGSAWREWGMRPRLEVRYAHDTFDGGQGDLVAALVLEIPKSRERVVEKIIEKEKIVEVEKVVEREVIREVPAPAPVVLDTDGDGVPDSADRCPDTVAGARVDPDGCVREAQVIVLPDIEFEFASARLTPAGRERLEPVVKFLRDQPEVTLDVWGHTDWIGTQEYNQPLSEARARAVRDDLVARGIAPGRLASAGFGELRPIASNETDEGRARNRRVELNIRTAAGAVPAGDRP